MGQGNRSLLLLALLGALALLLAAACDNGDPPAAPDTPTPDSPAMTPTPEPEQTPTPPPTPAPEPAPDGDATLQLSEEGPLAPFLVSQDGMTLYLFTNDEPGQSNCEGGCLENWPPLLVEDGDEPIAGDGLPGEIGTIERPEGRQVTYNGWPLYFWVNDAAAGDTTGHEVGGVWFVVPPDVDPIDDAEGDAADDENGGGSGAATGGGASDSY